jgi:hypothetical protein
MPRGTGDPAVDRFWAAVGQANNALSQEGPTQADRTQAREEHTIAAVALSSPTHSEAKTPMKLSKFCSMALAALAIVAVPARAGDFNVFCSYTNENLQKCAAVVSDIVTDKFTQKFPATKFQVFVHSHMQAFTDGGYAAYAVAGVIPKGSGEFPDYRVSTTNIDGTSKMFSGVQLAEIEKSNYRSAVRALMEKCEISPSCEIYPTKNR